MKTSSLVLTAALLSLLPHVASADPDVRVETRRVVVTTDRSNVTAGLALTIAGAALFVGGASVFVGALAMNPNLDALDVQFALLLAGPSAAALGIGLLIPGVIMLAKGSRAVELLEPPRHAGFSWTLAGPTLAF